MVDRIKSSHLKMSPPPPRYNYIVLLPGKLFNESGSPTRGIEQKRKGARSRQGPCTQGDGTDKEGREWPDRGRSGGKTVMSGGRDKSEG